MSKSESEGMSKSEDVSESEGTEGMSKPEGASKSEEGESKPEDLSKFEKCEYYTTNFESTMVGVCRAGADCPEPCRVHAMYTEYDFLPKWYVTESPSPHSLQNVTFIEFLSQFEQTLLL